jgi:hypothetical protein
MATAGAAGTSLQRCEPQDAATYALLTSVEREDCGFSLRDPQVLAALARFIFTQQQPIPVGETREMIPACDLFDSPAFRDPDHTDRAILCPGYCAVLGEWLTTNEALFRDCLTSAAP